MAINPSGNEARQAQFFPMRSDAAASATGASSSTCRGFGRAPGPQLAAYDPAVKKMKKYLKDVYFARDGYKFQLSSL